MSVTFVTRHDRSLLVSAGGRWWVSECSCGWSSALLTTERQAAEAFSEHLLQASRAPAKEARGLSYGELPAEY